MRNITIALLLILTGSRADAAPPLVKLGARDLKGYADSIGISSGTQWWGNIAHLGDTLELNAGVYELTFRFPPHTLELKVSVTTDTVAIDSWREGEPQCGVNVRDKVKTWDVTVRDIDGVSEIVLPSPTLQVTPYGRRSDCSLGEWTIAKTIPINVSSAPPGADIVIDDKKIGTTNTYIVAPLAEFRDGIYVVVKKPGFATCIRRIDSTAKSADAKCELRQLPTR
jgi:hypothetical protein